MDPFQTCDSLLSSVKSSNLNFSLIETPFSVTLTIRKSFVKDKNGFVRKSIFGGISQQNCHVLDEKQLLKNSALRDLHEAELAIKAKDDQIAEFEATVKHLKNKLEVSRTETDNFVDAKVKVIKDEKRSLQIKHEKMCSETKTVKQENENLKKELNSLNVALKSAKKEIKDTSKEFERNILSLGDKIQNLNDYKVDKVAEEKELRSKLKKADKKLKLLGEREAKLELDKIKFERNQRSNCIENKLENNINTIESSPSPAFENEPDIRKPTEETENVIECSICSNLFACKEDLREHNKKEHGDSNINCKLCDQTFPSMDQLIGHRAGESHMNISKSIANQFMLQIGNSCNECRVSESAENTNYYLCENDTHADIFENIWTKCIKSGSL